MSSLRDALHAARLIAWRSLANASTLGDELTVHGLRLRLVRGVGDE
jgi:hypothetical protein